MKSGLSLGTMGFYNLDGKKIGDLIGTYAGGELSGALIGNVGSMFARNANGIILNEPEIWSVGFGTTATQVKV